VLRGNSKHQDGEAAWYQHAIAAVRLTGGQAAKVCEAGRPLKNA
jgi:hypothetical protein